MKPINEIPLHGPALGRAEANAAELAYTLIDAIEASGFTVSGPTDHRVAENGEPHWVCNARRLIAEIYRRQ